MSCVDSAARRLRGTFDGGADAWRRSGAADAELLLANRATLDAFAQECLACGAPYDGALDGRRVSVPDNYPDMVRVAWFGFGLTPSGRYYELYYTADGAPHPCPGMEQYPETDTMFSFRWDEPDGDNGCLAEHIDGNWYYVESWF